MRFHQSSIELLRRNLRESDDCRNDLADAERRLGVQLPESVREWYSHAEAVEVLREFSNCDMPVCVSDWKITARDNGAPSLIVFKHENQGVCSWAFCIEGDDPVVMINLEGSGDKWSSCSATFSQYVYACVWDYGLLNTSTGLVQSQNKPLTQHAIATLDDRFEREKLTTGFPGRTQYRFRSGEKRILIWDDVGQSDWWLSAPDDSELEELILKICDLDDLSKTFWSNDSRGTDVLERVLGTRIEE